VDGSRGGLRDFAVGLHPMVRRLREA
jgi:hypothetical protein